MLFDHLAGILISMRELPNFFVFVDVVFDVFDVPTTLKHQHFESFFGEFFGGPASTDSGAYYDCVVHFEYVWCRYTTFVLLRNVGVSRLGAYARFKKQKTENRKQRTEN